jgi:MATE family multidrug resistance protein
MFGESKARNIRRELSWEARPVRELLRLSWPIAVSMVSYATMTLADTLFVARLGPAALAGVSIASVAYFTVICFGMGLLRGVKILISQARGAGAEDRDLPIIGAGLWFAMAFGAAVVLTGVLVAGFMPLLAQSLSSGIAARDYLEIRVLSAPLLLVYVALREARYGAGDSRSPMVASVLGNIVNIALDAWFVLGLGLGVQGAACATVIGHTVEAAVLVWLQAYRGFGLREVGLTELRALFSVGLPTGVQFVLEVGSFALLTALLASIGDLEVAAHNIALQVIHFTFLPTLAIAESVSVLTGQAVGARRPRLVPRVAHIGLWIVGAYASVCTLVLAVGAALIASAFTSDPQLLSRTTQLLWVAAVFQVFDGAGVVARGALRGTGDVRFSAAVGITCAWLMTPPLTWLLGLQLGLGALGGWIGLCLEIGLASALMWPRLSGVAWLPAARRSLALSTAEAAT